MLGVEELVFSFTQMKEDQGQAGCQGSRKDATRSHDSQVGHHGSPHPTSSVEMTTLTWYLGSWGWGWVV
jgi:hypothetical protein